MRGFLSNHRKSVLNLLKYISRSGNTSAGVPYRDRELASDIGETRDDPPVQESASMRQGRWLAGPFVQKTGRGRPVLR